MFIPYNKIPEFGDEVMYGDKHYTVVNVQSYGPFDGERLQHRLRLIRSNIYNTYEEWIAGKNYFYLPTTKDVYLYVDDDREQLDMFQEERCL